MKTTLLTTILSIAIFSVSYGQNSNVTAIKNVLHAYKTKIENLDTSGVSQLFLSKSKIIEQGKDEGTISHYLQHHLGPELKEFKSFKFSDYKVEVNVVGNYAFTTESYTYTITLNDDKQIKSTGLATSVLQKTNNKWKIWQSHSSFRRAK